MALVLVLLVSMFTQPCLAAENDLVTFDSYDARKYDSNGIRVIYTFDTTTLAELEKDYNVSVGVLLSAGITESTYETEMVIGKAKIDTTFYSPEKGYVGKYYEKADGNKEFVYAITYGNDAEKTDAMLSKAIASRAYVKLTPKTTGAATVYYVDSNSAEFGKALSMKELAENFVATTDKNYPILQRLLNSNLKEMLINNISIDKFSVTGADGEAVSEAIKEKLGYKLPIVTTPYFADSYISAGENNSLADNVLYKITASGAVINIGYKSASKDSAISKFKEFLNASGSTVETTEGKAEAVKYKVTYDEDKFIEVEEGAGFYKAKTFNDIQAISVPSNAIVTDLAVREGKLYALGFVKTNSSTNAYTNYIWSIDENDRFTQIRTFTSTGAYALSFDKDDEFFYVGLGGPTTHITTEVANVGNILKFSINPITE